MLCRKGAGKGKGYTENQNTEEGEKEEAGEIFQSAFHATLVFAASFLVQIHGSKPNTPELLEGWIHLEPKRCPSWRVLILRFTTIVFMETLR